MNDSELNVPFVPGRGFNTSSAVLMRLDYLRKREISLPSLETHQLPLDEVRNNIESFIGSVEIPVGLVGPLLYHGEDGQDEWVHAPAATLEGALVYSMNRGAKLISKSGGFASHFHHQKMLRAPMFILENPDVAQKLSEFISSNFDAIKEVAESYSNHGKLVEIQCEPIDNHLNAYFYFVTGDAAGQNLTTTCTWHSLQFIAENFDGEILDYVIEGNGASDKKISLRNIEKGRGCKVSAEVVVDDAVIEEVLRTTSDQIMRYFEPSKRIAVQHGMIGYSINAANAIAAIFAATGQDLACIHESATAFLDIERLENGLKFSLLLPNLVIGTVGGGTHLAKQSDALTLMGCKGSGKVKRFAELIAGFTLALEISTFGAIVSGEFAKSHEKLGRNKPQSWLLKSEVNLDFVKAILVAQDAPLVEFLEWQSHLYFDNGIITQLSQKVSKKLQGYYLLKVNESSNGLVLLKSRPTSDEVIKGLHLIAVSVDGQLADLLLQHRENLVFHQCHLKELAINRFLFSGGYAYAPKYYGDKIDSQREIFLLAQEYIYPQNTRLLNSEDQPHLWQSVDVIKCIDAINEFHIKTYGLDGYEDVQIPLQQPWLAGPFYHRLQEILVQTWDGDHLEVLKSLNIASLEEEYSNLKMPTCFIHNDFNPRNIMILKNGNPVIYDWELTMRDIPQRDIMELLCFVLKDNESAEPYLRYHCQLLGSDWAEYQRAAKYALKSLILTRFALYEVSGIVAKYEFSKRVMGKALQLTASPETF